MVNEVFLKQIEMFDLNKNTNSSKPKASPMAFPGLHSHVLSQDPFLGDKLMMSTATEKTEPFRMNPFDREKISYFEPSSSRQQVQMAPGDKHDLTSTGLMDDPTLERVFDAEAIVAIPHHGEHVRKIQQALMDLGIELPEFGADSHYGSETRNAVIEFQQQAGMSENEWDGIVGRKTIGLLDKSLRNGFIERDTDSSATDFTVFEPKEEDSSCEGADKDETCRQDFLDNIIDPAIDEAERIINRVKEKLPPDGDVLPGIYRILFMNNETRSIEENAADVEENFNRTKEFMLSLKDNRDLIRCATPCDGGCRAGSPAYHSPLPEAPFHLISFCRDFNSHPEKLFIMIHECHHAAVEGSADFAYPSERLIELLDVNRALMNAASYHLYATAVADPDKLKFGQQEEDQNLIIDDAVKNKVDLVIAFIEHWFSLNTFDISETITDGDEARRANAYDPDEHNNAIVFMDRVFSKWFGLTEPMAPPTQEDIDKLQAIEERLTTMEETFDNPFTINQTGGPSNWVNEPETSILLNPATLSLSQADLTMALLQELVNSIPHISAELEPLYVGAINDLRNLRRLDP
jgi:hypothetical protein